MTRKQAREAYDRCSAHFNLVHGYPEQQLWDDIVLSPICDCGWLDIDDICASILLSELATGAKEILPELGR